MKNVIILSLCWLFFFHPATNLRSQELQGLIWWNPAKADFGTIEGQGWSEGLKSAYDRFPARAEDQVREAVWNLSRHSAGILIRFRSNAEEITVRYKVGGSHAMEHMPATGVSGVDLYAIDSDGQWHWAKAQRSFKDTISYRYSGLIPNDEHHDLGREYRLYLPLYNSVEWLEIGVRKKDYFRPLPTRLEKPIVVYGTSIAHGACASRPGMAWTAILGRKMDHPVINLAFSGNGRLESEVVDLIKEIDAKIFILDCLPNLTNKETYPDKALKNRILETVQQLRSRWPNTPLLLVEHAGYTDGTITPGRQDAYRRVNQLQKEAFAALLEKGIKDVYYLTYDEINLQMDDMVDGTHPNDLGMQHYAEGYEKKLRSILHEPIGGSTTMQPCTQYREPNNYDWEERHREILQMNKEEAPKSVIIGNSIIHFWGGLPRSQLVIEEASWQEYLTPAGVRNYGYGWDRIENVLWRIYHGELDGFNAKKILIMIGTNNLHLNSDEEIIDGLTLLVEMIKVRQPLAEITIMGILPRRNYESRISILNLHIAQIASTTEIGYGDIGPIFLEGLRINESLFSDGLHPNAEGYRRMKAAMEGYIP